MGNIIGIISIKGGVGKTSTVVGLGASLANDFGKKVLLVDANFSAPTLALYLGFPNPGVTLHHVLTSNKGAEEAIYKTKQGFHILPGALIHNKKINPFHLKKKINWLRDHYDVILIDSSPSLNNEILATMIASDALLVVTTADHVTLSSTLHAVKVAKQRKTPIYGIILNKVHNKNFELDIFDIEDAANCPVLAVLPYDVRFLEALAVGVPSTLYSSGEATMEYRKLAAALLGQTYDDPRFSKKVQRFFRQDATKQDMNRALFKDLLGGKLSGA